MKRRNLTLFLLLAVLTLSLPDVAVQAAPRCFPETPAIGDCIDGRFRTFWEQQGGLPVFGYPLSPAYQEQTLAGAPRVQRFERARLELHPEQPAPYDVLLGRLGIEVLEKQGRDWNAFPKADPAIAHYFRETGHAIAPQFWPFWSSHGLEFDQRPGKSFAESLALFGMPLSEAQMEVNPADGGSYLTQWFERARFEYHPEHAKTPNEVQLGLLERELDTPGVAPAAAPQTALEPGGFIHVSGAQLTRLGKPLLLKGVNYYPQGRPWLEMWQAWEGPQVERELRLARDQLGINTVRVLLPYNVENGRSSAGKVTPQLLKQLREMTQIAGKLNMRLIVSLFDFYEEFPLPGSAEEAKNIAYLETLIGNFVGDDRIIAWDIHNEPDHYDLWKNGDAARVLTWLGRMADVLHRIAPNHLVTVGMGQYDHLLLPGPDGRRVIDYSDVISVHNYNAADTARQLDTVRAHSGKPILLEEFGWPTGISCMVRNYNEDQQAWVYRETLAAARSRVVGVIAWTLRDFDPGPSTRMDSREEHYGLYRTDDSLKPAAQELLAYAVPPLPSVVSTDLPLSASGPNIPGSEFGPLLVPESGHYVKGWFRRAWRLLGGQGSFGLPLSETFILPGATPKEDRQVQYFEAAVLELHPEAANEPGFPLLPDIEKAARLIHPRDIGRAYTAARSASLASTYHVEGVFQSFYKAIHGDWRLGPPISAELVEEIGGVPTTVQYFQRGRLELNSVTQVVRVGPLGSWAWDMQCRSAQ